MDDVPHLDASGNIAKMVLMMPNTIGTSSLFIDEEFFIGNVRFAGLEKKSQAVSMSVGRTWTASNR